MELKELEKFLRKASLMTYAGDGKRIKSDKSGFYDLEYHEGDFYYRDSFAGFLSSHGQEIIWFQDKPVWMCSYTGGMRNSKKDDAKFANETFEFLKKAMQKQSTDTFRHRGPETLINGSWTYRNNFSGTLNSFSGHEEISYEDELVFVHDYMGGSLKDGRG